MDTDDSKLSRLLGSREPDHIDDAGFTARVMASLPPPRGAAGSLRRAVLLASSLILSVALALLLAGPDILEGISALLRLATDRPVIMLPGLSLGVFPAACFAAGLCVAGVTGYRVLRQAMR
jgi:hypothetical protein